MSINLHPECQTRLIELIGLELPQIEVKNNSWIVYGTATGFYKIDEVPPKQKELQAKLQQYINERPLSNFFYERLFAKVYESREYELEKAPFKLTTLPEFVDTHAVAQELLKEFESLPWKYTLTFGLVKKVGAELRRVFNRFDLSDDLYLIAIGPDYDQAFPPQSSDSVRVGSSLTGLLEQKSWDQDTVYLKGEVNGFVGRFTATTPMEDFQFRIRAFTGLALAVRLFKMERTYYGGPPLKYRIHVHREKGGAWQGEDSHEIETDKSDGLAKLDIETFDGAITGERLAKFINNRLKLISFAFNQSKNGQRLQIAGQWFFDSYCGKNDLLSFVQTMVALEILLGDRAASDLMGLSELLRNRCAYLIGDSHARREEILNDFKEIYEVRSSIVHRGKNKMNLRERLLFAKLRGICSDVISKELELLSPQR